jgi:hypothetical protein
MAEERYGEILDIQAEADKYKPTPHIAPTYETPGFPLEKGWLVHSFSVPAEHNQGINIRNVMFIDNYGNILKGYWYIGGGQYAPMVQRFSFHKGMPQPLDQELSPETIDALKATFIPEFADTVKAGHMRLDPIIQYINSLEHPAPPVNMGPPVNRTKQGGARRAKHTRRRSRK